MEDKGKGRWLLRNDDRVVLKKSYNAQRLKLWLTPNKVTGKFSLTSILIAPLIMCVLLF